MPVPDRLAVLCLIDSLAMGGAEQSLVALAPALREHGVDVEVAHLRDQAPLAPALLAQGVPVHEVGGAGRAQWVRGTTSLLRSRRPHLLHTTLFESDQAGRVAARLTRVPVVSSFVNVPYGPEQRSDQTLSPRRLAAARAVDMVTSRFAVRFHAITRTAATAMSQRLRVPLERIDVIPRGRADATLGRRTPERRRVARERLGVDMQQPLVVAAARHEHQKGLDVLISAFRLVDPALGARLVIAGRRGNRTRELEQLAAESGLDPSLTLLGARDDVAELLAAADVFSMPSRWEGLGSVLIEAMALEAPVVASDLAAVREIVRDGREALLVPASDPSAMARGIEACLSDRAAAVARAADARARFLEHFEIGAIAAQTAAFYRRAVAAAGRSR